MRIVGTTSTRWVINAAAILGMLVLALQVVAGTAKTLGYALGPCTSSSGFPWGIVFVACFMLAPGILGQDRSERIIDRMIDLTGRVLRRSSTQKVVTDAEHPESNPDSNPSSEAPKQGE